MSIREQLDLFNNPNQVKEKDFLNTFELKQNHKALIEISLPFHSISIEGTSERYSHGKTPHSIHIWWARRPLSSMRSIIFASLAHVHDTEEFRKLIKLCSKLSRFDPLPIQAITEAQEILGNDKSVLDLFGGGGSIALEASRIGAKAKSIELSVTMQKRPSRKNNIWISNKGGWRPEAKEGLASRLHRRCGEHEGLHHKRDK